MSGISFTAGMLAGFLCGCVLVLQATVDANKMAVERGTFYHAGIQYQLRAIPIPAE